MGVCVRRSGKAALLRFSEHDFESGKNRVFLRLRRRFTIPRDGGLLFSSMETWRLQMEATKNTSGAEATKKKTPQQQKLFSRLRLTFLPDSLVLRVLWRWLRGVIINCCQLTPIFCLIISRVKRLDCSRLVTCVGESLSLFGSDGAGLRYRLCEIRQRFMICGGLAGNWIIKKFSKPSRTQHTHRFFCLYDN